MRDMAEQIELARKAWPKATLSQIAATCFEVVARGGDDCDWGWSYGYETPTVRIKKKHPPLACLITDVQPAKAIDQLVQTAVDDAAAFVAEFNSVLIPEETDWDAYAWGDAKRRMQLSKETSDLFGPIYDAMLIVETRRLVTSNPN